MNSEVAIVDVLQKLSPKNYTDKMLRRNVVSCLSVLILFILPLFLEASAGNSKNKIVADNQDIVDDEVHLSDEHSHITYHGVAEYQDFNASSLVSTMVESITIH